MRRLLKYFIVGLACGFGIFFPIFLILNPFDLALMLSLVSACIYGLFSMGFMTRILKRVSYDINSSNKDPEKGLKWYEDKILDQIYSMRFRLYLDDGKVKKFRPIGIYQVLEEPIELRVTPYDITIKSSKLMRKVLMQLVDVSYEL